MALDLTYTVEDVNRYARYFFLRWGARWWRLPLAHRETRLHG